MHRRCLLFEIAMSTELRGFARCPGCRASTGSAGSGAAAAHTSGGQSESRYTPRCTQTLSMQSESQLPGAGPAALPIEAPTATLAPSRERVADVLATLHSCLEMMAGGEESGCPDRQIRICASLGVDFTQAKQVLY